MADTDIKTLNKVAKALEELPADERKNVLAFLGEPAPMLRRAAAAHRIVKLLEPLEAGAQARILGFFEHQLSRPADDIGR